MKFIGVTVRSTNATEVSSGGDTQYNPGLWTQTVLAVVVWVKYSGVRRYKPQSNNNNNNTE